MANFSASQTEDLQVIKDLDNSQSCTHMPNSDPPPPYTVIDVAPTPVPPETDRSQPVANQEQITIIVPGVLNKNPVYLNCPSCHQRTLTSVRLVNTQKTHMLAGFICGLTLWCMICCLSVIPYIIPACKNAEHYCPHCNYFIGSSSNVN